MLLFQSRLSASRSGAVAEFRRETAFTVMKLSSSSDYGIRALVDLAQRDAGDPVPATEIAQRQGIPGSLVGQVLGRLRAAGFIASVRGAQGGHRLALPAEEIRLDAVVQALEGPLAIAACLEREQNANGHGKASERCTGAAAQVPLWDDVRAAMIEVLASRSIADLAQDSAHLSAPAGGRYHI